MPVIFSVTSSPGRRDAGWIVGLAFGFAPYRADQLTHIQVLASFWMPLVLLGLHRYLRRGRRRWLVLFGLSLLMQGLCNLYYMLYVPVLVGLWGLWFIVDPRVGWRRVGSRVGAVVAVAALAHLPVLPVLHHYSEVHESLGFSRSVVQAEHFSADLTDLLSASKNLTAWGFEHRFRKATGMKLFPGLTILLLIVVAAVRLPRPDKQRSPGWLSRVHLVLGVLGVAGCLALAARLALGPWEVELLGLELSVSRLSRAVTLTVAVWTLFALSGPALLGAWRRKSVPLFYLLAAALLWVLALGPKPTLMGEPILTTAPVPVADASTRLRRRAGTCPLLDAGRSLLIRARRCSFRSARVAVWSMAPGPLGVGVDWDPRRRLDVRNADLSSTSPFATAR